MRSPERLCNLRPEMDQLRCFERSAVNDRFERLAFDVLHRNKGEPFRLFDGVNRDDIRMIQSGCGPCFLQQPLFRLFIFGGIGRQKLEGDLAAELLVFGFKTSPIPPCPIFSSTR